jgi:hypothetical protein
VKGYRASIATGKMQNTESKIMHREGDFSQSILYLLSKKDVMSSCKNLRRARVGKLMLGPTDHMRRSET